MMLTVGSQRSYSDVCQTAGEILKAGTANISVTEDGILKCDAGCTLYQVLQSIHPHWSFPVVPGTGWATIGGCIANDVHGKNHQTQGSFGNHILGLHLSGPNFELDTAPPSRVFAATVGGLGLTGTITSAKIQLVWRKPFKPWLFPLDYIPRYWPTYKRLGFWQFHCVVPTWRAANRLLRWAYQRPLLIVRKTFGDIPSVGMLSFCRPGFSVSMDFARSDPITLKNLCAAAIDSGGAVYPAKTSMSKLTFRYSFPRWKEFSQYVDPQYSSDFWQRVNSGP